MPRRFFIFIAGFFLLSLVSACASQEKPTPPGSTREVRDDLGRPVMFARTPERLISLAPNITEMLFALGLGERVVGVTTYCTYPAEARTKAQIGDTIHPGVERILALKPDLVIASRASQLEAFAQQLYQVGIPLYVVDAQVLADVPRSLRRLGSWLGRQEQAEAVAQGLEQRIRQVEQQSRRAPLPKVLVVIQREPLMVPGTKSYLADLIHKAGGTLIGPDDAREGVTYSLESVIAQRPQFIILPGDSGSSPQRVSQFTWPQLAETPAIRNRQIYSLDADLMMRPGPRLVDGLAQLARILQTETRPR
jgi:iron complex transport system substrate-binding protein